MIVIDFLFHFLLLINNKFFKPIKLWIHSFLELFTVLNKFYSLIFSEILLDLYVDLYFHFPFQVILIIN